MQQGISARTGALNPRFTVVDFDATHWPMHRVASALMSCHLASCATAVAKSLPLVLAEAEAIVEVSQTIKHGLRTEA